MTPPTVAPGSAVVMRRHGTSPDAVPSSFCVSSPMKHSQQGQMVSYSNAFQCVIFERENHCSCYVYDIDLRSETLYLCHVTWHSRNKWRSWNNYNIKIVRTLHCLDNTSLFTNRCTILVKHNHKIATPTLFSTPVPSSGYTELLSLLKTRAVNAISLQLCCVYKTQLKCY
jgi:hypothetical protein